MNENVELLNFIYQNSEMGVSTIKQLLDIVEAEEFKRLLESQYNEYEEIHIEARKKLNENGYDEKGIGALKKLRTNMMINMQTLTDKTASHIAEMLIVGSNMGIINAIKNLKKYQNADSGIRKLMERLLKLEEDNVQELKEFL
ncbi:MAG TPA: hypothetical protein GX692_03730 [Acholeplasmataceae bacterium]|nr:hypothetical protein [Acholeplasmataceae bacterium]